MAFSFLEISVLYFQQPDGFGFSRHVFGGTQPDSPGTCSTTALFLLASPRGPHSRPFAHVRRFESAELGKSVT